MTLKSILGHLIVAALVVALVMAIVWLAPILSHDCGPEFAALWECVPW